MIVVKSILIGLRNVVLGYLGAWFSLFIAANFCSALALEPGAIGTQIVFWVMMLIQILWLTTMYALITKWWRQRKNER